MEELLINDPSQNLICTETLENDGNPEEIQEIEIIDPLCIQNSVHVPADSVSDKNNELQVVQIQLAYEEPVEVCPTCANCKQTRLLVTEFLSRDGSGFVSIGQALSRIYDGITSSWQAEATIGMCDQCTTILAEMYRFHIEFIKLRPGGHLEMGAGEGTGGVQDRVLLRDEYMSMIGQSHLLPPSNGYHYSRRSRPIDDVTIDEIHEVTEYDLRRVTLTDEQKTQLKMKPAVKLFRLEAIGLDRPPYKCFKCGARYDQATRLDWHLIAKHNFGHQLPDRVCPEESCQKYFIDRIAMLRHAKNTHCSDEEKTCRYCNFKATSKIYLRQHLRQNHRQPQNDDVQVLSQPQPESTSRSSQPVWFEVNTNIDIEGILAQIHNRKGNDMSREASPPPALEKKQIEEIVLSSSQETMLSAKTSRSQLLAYVSFSAIDDPVVGDPTEGGRLKPHTVCDWIYDNCWTRECILVSPGYPGLSPPYRTCRYFLEGNSTTNRIRLIFHALSFPKPQHCSTHRLTIWRNVTSIGTSTTTDLGPPWKVLCEDSEAVVDIDDASHAVLEFKSGATTTPFIHNGFRANVEFIQMQSPPFIEHGSRNPKEDSFIPPAAVSTTSSTTTTSTHSPTRPYKHFPQAPPQRTTHTTTTRTTTTAQPRPRPRYEDIEAPLGNPRASFGTDGIYPITCGHIFEGESIRGGVFRLLIPKDISVQLPRAGTNSNTLTNFGYHTQTKKQLLLGGPFRCQIEFRGRAADIVQFAAFTYKFRGSNCSAQLEVYDMAPERTPSQSDRLLGTICGPSTGGTGSEQHYSSSYSRMALIALIFPQDEPAGNEFLEGAFRFHDESLEGTVKPMSSCETVYYGVASKATGTISGPSDSPLLTRLSSFPLVCAHSFVPGPNQTVALTLNRAGHESSDVVLPGAINYCRTVCKTSGCECEATGLRYMPMNQVDHLLLLSGAAGSMAAPISCLCGYFKDLLPLTFESHTPLTLVYQTTSASREFTYTAGFQFKRKITCSNFTIQPPSSSKRWKEILGPSAQYYNRHGATGSHLQFSYYQCTWPVSIPTRYKLSLNFISEENEDDCRTWNLTLYAGANHALDPAPEDMLYSFCPKQGRKEYQMPDSIDGAFIRLIGVTIRPPQFEIRWKYVDVMLGSGFLTERVVTNDSESNVVTLNLNLLTSLLVIMLILHKLVLVSSNSS